MIDSAQKIDVDFSAFNEEQKKALMALVAAIKRNDDSIISGASGSGPVAPFRVGIGGLLGSNPLLYVREEQASGVQGGAFNNGAWRTRVLNAALTSEIAGGGLAVAPAGANQILLPTGTYWVEAQAPAAQVDGHKAKLRNVTNAADLLIGTSEFSASGALYAETKSGVSGQIVLAAPTVVELQHQCAASRAVYGLGTATGLDVEVYAEVMVWKIG